jgi:hypothetical protein
MNKFGGYLLDKYNKKQVHKNIFSIDVWRRKLEGAGFKIKNHFFLFCEKDYKKGILLDFLSNSFLNRIYLIFTTIIPLSYRKFLWRRLLKPIYLRSAHIDCGGEIVMVAEKK